MNGEEPPLKKTKLPNKQTSNPSLPEDLLLSILARVSRLYYPTLSLVSKHFRSLLTSSELYRTRSLLGCTENFLYVCLRLSRTDHTPRWYMLRPRPNPILTNRKKKNKSSGYVLSTIPFTHYPRGKSSALVTVGSKIYNIGGVINGSASSTVSILDCWSHTWLQAPSMQMERDSPSANFLDGKIYVTGFCYRKYDPSNWMEVFDLKTETWEPVLSRAGRLTIYRCHDHTYNVVVDEKVYIIGDKGVAYNPKDGTWNSLGPEMDLRLNGLSACVIENVLYYYSNEETIQWYDTKARSWRVVNGLKKLPKFARFANVRLADYGGKMALFWDKFVASGGGGGYENRMIWCAMIALERSNSVEIWGQVEWFGAVLKNPIPVEYGFEYVAAVNV
ncbi:hypothetical protein CARUB_v10021597mg [Capsella rubella]|uniref:F-box domain-containing protein n=1 Tax=Capsella rubella TaxID=81985 RepID=R0GE81_9BRAS|nr:putative F-box/kelch-repeat protein At1g60570 [Capsella rubella]EOA34097.1 hypothetical protein CARUB_v10021597mg [Capsella rubella]